MPFENFTLIIDHNVKNFINFCLKDYIINMYLIFKVFNMLIIAHAFLLFFADT